MTAPLLSTSWYRVAGLKPRLRSHVRLHRHRYRGELWYLLQDPATGKVHRFTPAARMIIAAMDGARSVEDLWALAGKRLGEGAPTQDDVIHLLGQLHAADLLSSDVTPDTAELFSRGEREEKARRRRSFANPMAMRFPLWDPDAFLERWRGPIRMIWSRWGALLWIAVVLPALLLVPLHWPDLTSDFSDRVLAIDNLLVLYLVFPLIKALHELGHATATKAGGGEVHDMGDHGPGPAARALRGGLRRDDLPLQVRAGAGGCRRHGGRAVRRRACVLRMAADRARRGARDPVQRDADCERVDPDLQRQPAAALRRLLHPGRPDRDSQPVGSRRCATGAT